MFEATGCWMNSYRLAVRSWYCNLLQYHLLHVFAKFCAKPCRSTVMFETVSNMVVNMTVHGYQISTDTHTEFPHTLLLLLWLTPESHDHRCVWVHKLMGQFHKTHCMSALSCCCCWLFFPIMHWGAAGQEDSRMAAMDFETETNSIAAVWASAHMVTCVRGLPHCNSLLQQSAVTCDRKTVELLVYLVLKLMGLLVVI